MNVEVSKAIAELEIQFVNSPLTIRDDNQGGAYVIVDSITLGTKYKSESTWLGFQIPAQYPYADIYPVFMGAEVVKADGTEFVVPITRGHTFESRHAIQISRRNGAANSGSQKVTMKLLKILDFLENL